jgi:hypothetical protein
LILFSGHHYVGSISIVVVVSPPPEYEPQITLRTQGGGGNILHRSARRLQQVATEWPDTERKDNDKDRETRAEGEVEDQVL